MKNTFALFLLLSISSTYAFENAGRFGFGATAQTYQEKPAVSIKIHFSEKMALGAFFAYEGTEEANYSIGARFYSAIVSEPNLIFYTVISGAMLQIYDGTTSSSGYQADINIGTELFFEEIKHIGLSFEAGIGVTNIDEFVINTNASHIFKSAVHFYF